MGCTIRLSSASQVNERVAGHRGWTSWHGKGGDADSMEFLAFLGVLTTYGACREGNICYGILASSIPRYLGYSRDGPTIITSYGIHGPISYVFSTGLLHFTP